MRAPVAFLLGVLAAKTAMRIASVVVSSDTPIGKEVREKLYAKRSLERLLRTEAEVGDEINRRVREREMAL